MLRLLTFDTPEAGFLLSASEAPRRFERRLEFARVGSPKRERFRPKSRRLYFSGPAHTRMAQRRMTAAIVLTVARRTADPRSLA
jgi:hypothetical protein